MKLKDNYKLSVSIKAADEFGNPTDAGFDAPPAWSQSDESVLKVVASDDGMSASVASNGGKLAASTIQVSGKVNGKDVLGSLEVEIVAGDVAQIVLQPGEPVADDAPQA